MTNKALQFEPLRQTQQDVLGGILRRQATSRAAIDPPQRVLSNAHLGSRIGTVDVDVTSSVIDLKASRLYASLLTIQPRESTYRSLYSHIFLLESPEGSDPPDYSAIARAISTVVAESAPRLTKFRRWQPLLPVPSARFEMRYTQLQMEPDEHQGLAISFAQYALHDISQYLVLAEGWDLKKQIDFIDESTSEHLLIKWSQPLRGGISWIDGPTAPSAYRHSSFTEKRKGSPRYQHLISRDASELLDESEGTAREDLSQDYWEYFAEASSGQVTGALSRPTEWTDEKNQRRCDLIDKEIADVLSIDECQELEELQAEMLAFRRRVAPRPLKDLRELHQELLRRALENDD